MYPKYPFNERNSFSLLLILLGYRSIAVCKCNYISKYLFSPGHGPVQCYITTLQDMVQYNIGSLSRITFHYPPTFSERDVVLIISRWDLFLHELFLCLYVKIVSRFMRTKKDRDRYKFKQDEVIANVIEGKANDRRESKVNIPLSYGTV